MRVRQCEFGAAAGVRSGVTAGIAMVLALAVSGCGDAGEQAAGQMIDALDRGKVTGTRGTMETIAQGLRAYSVDHSGYPEVQTIEALMAELVPAHLRAPVTSDAWGRPFSYQGGSDGFTLASSGQDGSSGTGDDVVMIDGRFEAMAAPGGP
ncbi:MAG TPA: type II secretion system protein GspG [Candidatus Polarisedimenticolia bacterium]|nr:type II secretion system protein GspG [Candidatus Polarisedimenticolia bacterium]